LSETLRDALDIAAADLRADLHRYCARLTGSVFDGEDIVQDTLARAYAGINQLAADTPLKPWLFRIAHNRAIDHVRSRAVRATDPMEAAAHVADETGLDPAEAVLRQEAVATALDRFLLLPTVQRSAVILKDVLGHSLEDIASLLDLSVNAVKAALHRGRGRLKEINADPAPEPVRKLASAQALLFARLFNARDWDALRALLAEDARLNVITKPARSGKADVGFYFTRYSEMQDWRLAPAWLEGREVFAVFETGDLPRYFVEVDWRDGQIITMRDFYHARHVTEGAAIVLAGD
jgi:RNA polymerase sigma factor (sigma-70 family)